MTRKRPMGISVLAAAQARIALVFNEFARVCVSFSGGKDSSVLLHLVMAEAVRRRRKVAVLFIDLEAQYALTIEHVQAVFALYADSIEPYWVALPLALRNAVSNYEPQWQCWDPDRRDDWVREPSALSITDPSVFPFFSRGMEFEDFVERFGAWYADGVPTMCLVGIRTDESLNRYRAIAGSSSRYEGHCWTTYKDGALFNGYPIYDWRTEDIWRYVATTQAPYNRLYDRMHQAGLSIHQQRICQPYGDDQRKGLWLYQIIEPETWGRVVARVNGANSGALYSRDSGNVNGRLMVTKPPGHTWHSFADLLLATMPQATREHYENKIAVFRHWWHDRGYPNGIPDDGPTVSTSTPSWARVCKTLLRNDYWCKGLSFSQHKSGAYDKYRKVMKHRRQQWGF